MRRSATDARRPALAQDLLRYMWTIARIKEQVTEALSMLPVKGGCGPVAVTTVVSEYNNSDNP